MSLEKIKVLLEERWHEIPANMFSLFESLVESENNLNVDSVKKITEYAFNTDSPTKGMGRAVIRSLSEFEQPDFESLNFTRALIKSSTVKNNDTLIQVLNSQEKALKSDLGSSGMLIKHVKALSKHYNASRIVKLLWSSELLHLSDTLSMMEKITKNHPSLNYLPKKPKSIMDIHDCCVRALPKVNQDNYSLEQRDDVLLLDNLSVDEEHFIKVPKTHFDLVDLGESLNFCIGNGGYSKKVLDKKASIVAVFDKKGPKYGVEFTRYNINQAHGFSNISSFSPSKDFLKKLESLITKEPELPTDFIKITDSHWVNGYKYDGKDLYLLLKDKIYVYFDVPKDVYEEMLNGDLNKGTFVNKQIKPHYSCEFLSMLY